MAHMFEKTAEFSEASSEVAVRKSDEVIGMELTAQGSQQQLSNNFVTDVKATVSQLHTEKLLTVKTLCCVQDSDACIKEQECEDKSSKAVFTVGEINLHDSDSDDLMEIDSGTDSNSDVSDTVIEEALVKAVYSKTFTTTMEVVCVDENNEVSNIALKTAANFQASNRGISSAEGQLQNDMVITVVPVTECSTASKLCDNPIDTKPVICRLCGSVCTTEENLKIHICGENLNHDSLNDIGANTALHNYDNDKTVSSGESQNNLPKNGGVEPELVEWSPIVHARPHKSMLLANEQVADKRGALSHSTTNVDKKTLLEALLEPSVVTDKTKVLLAQHIVHKLTNRPQLRENYTKNPEKNPLLSLLLGHSPKTVKDEKPQFACLAANAKKLLHDHPLNSNVKADNLEKFSASFGIENELTRCSAQQRLAMSNDCEGLSETPDDLGLYPQYGCSEPSEQFFSNSQLLRHTDMQTNSSELDNTVIKREPDLDHDLFGFASDCETNKPDTHNTHHTEYIKCVLCGALFATNLDLAGHTCSHGGVMIKREKNILQEETRTPNTRTDKAHKVKLCDPASAEVLNMQQHKYCQNDQPKHEAHNDLNLDIDLSLEMHSFNQTNPISHSFDNSGDFLSSDLDLQLYAPDGETPFECPECDVTYTQREAFLTHCLSHTYGKSYTTEVCVLHIAENELLQRQYNFHLDEGNYGYTKENVPNGDNTDSSFCTSKTSYNTDELLVLPLASECQSDHL